MSKYLKIALAFAGLAAIGVTAAQADWRDRRDGRSEHRNMMMERFEQADTDDSGDVTLEEFQKAISGRLANADTDGDKKLTVGEIAAEIVRMHAERRARRIISGYDINDDGELTFEEIENRGAKMFALMDRDDDGKVEEDEMRRHRKMHHRRDEGRAHMRNHGERYRGHDDRRAEMHDGRERRHQGMGRDTMHHGQRGRDRELHEHMRPYHRDGGYDHHDMHYRGTHRHGMHHHESRPHGMHGHHHDDE